MIILLTMMMMMMMMMMMIQNYIIVIVIIIRIGRSDFASKLVPKRESKIRRHIRDRCMHCIAWSQQGMYIYTGQRGAEKPVEILRQ
jgi:hypothetical protein